MQRIGRAAPAAALRYQHVMDGRDAAVASALDDMIEDADERSGTRMARRPRSGAAGRGVNWPRAPELG